MNVVGSHSSSKANATESVRLRLTFTVLVLALVAGTSSLTTWYTVDRTGMLTSLCEAGLPNITRPAELDPKRVGCRVVKEKRRYFGSVRDTSLGHTFFESADLEGFDEVNMPRDGIVRLQCEGNECGAALENQLEKTKLNSCVNEEIEMRFSGAIIEGWVTEKRIRYGHTGTGFSRSLYADRVVEVFDPPGSLVSKWEWIAADRRACETTSQ